MCGRFVLRASPHQVQTLFDLDEAPHAAPTVRQRQMTDRIADLPARLQSFYLFQLSKTR